MPAPTRIITIELGRSAPSARAVQDETGRTGNTFLNVRHGTRVCFRVI